MVATEPVVDLGPRQPAYRGGTLAVPSAAARRLLSRLDKLQLIELVLHWMRATGNDRHPPRLSRASRAPGATNQDDVGTSQTLADAVSTQRRVGSYAAAYALWDGPMRDDRVPKVRAVDRIVGVDWPDGLSFSMIADVDSVYLASHPESRQWAAAKLVFAPEKKDSAIQVSPEQLRSNLSRELQLYFGHYVYLFPVQYAAERAFATPSSNNGAKDKSSTPTWFSPFTSLRICAAPLPNDVCGRGGGGALWLLYIPHTPWVLYSGALGRQDSPTEARKLALYVFAQAVGATSVQLPSQPSSSTSTTPSSSSSSSSFSSATSELKGRDALGLRMAILRSCAPSGGHGTSLLRGTAEDDPLIDASHRIREHDPVRAYGLPSTKDPQAQVRAAREREARDLFGSPPTIEAADGQIPRVKRIDYELRLPFPVGLLDSPYRSPDPDLLRSNPIGLRLEGAHVAAGLRKVVLGGLDVDDPLTFAGLEQEDEEGPPPPTVRQGLPLWLTEVRGTNVVVGLKQ